MAFSLGQYQTAWDLIPDLPIDDVRNALKRAKRVLPVQREEELHERLAEALKNYVAEKLYEVGTADVTRSSKAKRLERIALQARRLRRVIPDDKRGVTIAASQELRRALMQTPWLRRTLVLPPNDPAGFAALEAVAAVVEILADAANQAHRRERMLIDRDRKAKGKARHKGDTAMRTLIGEINGIWIDVFEELPGVTLSRAPDKDGGSYLPFAHSLLHAYADRLPAELQRLAHLRARLRLTQDAIRGHFRATGISRLRRMA